MALNQIDVADLDCIYLTYDEPEKEEFWVKIRNMVPWAKRVDGVKGSDAAHKAAAAASETERFILIDGDNMPDPEFFNQTLTLEKYRRADEAKIKELTLQIEKLTIEVGRKCKELE